MRLYLLRHADAVDHPDDDVRVLSAQGKKSLERLTGHLRAQRLLSPITVWHSPLLRAVETAQLVARGLQWDAAKLTVRQGLRPEDDPAALAEVLERRRDDLLVVGHEPFLSTLGTLLLTGETFPPRVQMRKAALLCLERQHAGPLGGWWLQWHLAPELFETPSHAARTA
jgi:phosphohistidine phosphatase